MKTSIRSRFTVIFVSLMALSVGAVWCINNWFLEAYYQNYKIRILENGYHAIDSILREQQSEWEEALNEAEGELNGSGPLSGEQEAKRLSDTILQMRERSNITLLIYDSMQDKAMVSSSRDIDMLRERVRQYIVGYDAYLREILREHDNYMIQKTYDPRIKTFYLESWGFFSDNRTIFIMRTPLESIRESASISNRFLMWVGLFVILSGSLILYFITRPITAPIHRLSQLSEKMSHLDFEAKYVPSRHSTEEIDILGNSMNVLSDTLKETIRKLKSANNELQLDIEKKTQIDEMRKDFIANVSHELKTPIALIQGYAEGLVEGMGEDKDSRDYYCGVIVDEAGKMNQMVRQLLTLTALEFGNEQASMERFDLTELINGILTSSGLLLKQKDIDIFFPCSGPLYVWGDEFKIEEVVTNYVTNAIHHADGEKRIEIRTEPREKDGKREVRVSVFNTGLPIPEEDLPRIWTKFYKVDKARTRQYGGSGIGLSIVKAIMESHHKAYGVRNRENGVEFWFTLDS